MKRAVYITTLFEAQVPRTLFFGTAQQGITGALIPRVPQSRHRKGLVKPILYATDSPAYAAGFTFEWTEQQGLGFGKYGRTGHYILTIPYSALSRLDAPCSIYTISGYFRRLRTSTPEYITYQPATILSEKRYSSVDECLHETGVFVHVTQTSRGKR